MSFIDMFSCLLSQHETRVHRRTQIYSRRCIICFAV